MKPARQTSTERTNSLAIDQAVLDALTHRLEQPNAKNASAVRATVRLPFRRLSVRMSVLHNDGTTASIVVACRNLSSGGVGIFHSAYMHVGTHCAVALPRHGKPELVTRGTVVRCRHLGGRVHELGIMFAEPIEPRDFVEATAEDTRAVLAAVRPAEFAAVVALHIQNEPLRRSVERLLAETKAKVLVQKPEDTKAPARVDALLAELPMTGVLADCVLNLAELSGGAPIVLVVPENTPGSQQRLREFACDGSIAAPFDTLALTRSLIAAICLAPR
jgi:hypothetical protein